MDRAHARRRRRGVARRAQAGARTQDSGRRVVTQKAVSEDTIQPAAIIDTAAPARPRLAKLEI